MKTVLHGDGSEAITKNYCPLDSYDSNNGVVSLGLHERNM